MDKNMIYKNRLPFVKRFGPMAALVCLVSSSALHAEPLTLTQQLEQGLGLSAAQASTPITNEKSTQATAKQAGKAAPALTLTQQLEQGLGLVPATAVDVKTATQDKALVKKTNATEKVKEVKKSQNLSQRSGLRLGESSGAQVMTTTTNLTTTSNERSSIPQQMEASLAASQLGLLAMAQIEDPAVNQQNLSQQIETLKQAMVNLNRDLFILEEDLLFPASTQVAVYLSMDVGEYFALDAVEIRINGDVKTYYLYTDRQVNALYRGGVQRLYVGNVNRGEHELSAYFIGVGPENREYKRSLSVRFTKTEDPVALALNVVDSTQKQQPVFEASVL
jgi:hypothetical protein